MKQFWNRILTYCKIAIGCAVFGVGFNLFLAPYELNAGGVSGLSMVIVHAISFGSVGIISLIINLPLFGLAGFKIGKEYFVNSLVGMAFLSLFVDLFAFLPVPETEVLISAIYGGAICGLGLGYVFVVGGSTGGSDIICRFLKLKYQNVPIGIITTAFDAVVAILTGIVYGNFNLTLYSMIAIVITGRVIDGVVYSFDFSKVAIIISQKHDLIAQQIGAELQRGATFLEGQGAYTGKNTKVILTAVKIQQVAELKALVVDIDPDAFIIVQDAHQVLGDGFIKYSKFNL